MRRRFILNKSSANNIIRYTSTDGNVVIPYQIDFGTSLISNIYTDKGLMVFESDVRSIGNKAFYDCSNLTNIEIPNSVTKIGNYAFYKCLNLTNIEIPNSVIRIEEGAFEGCSCLTSIEIPNNVTYIGDGIFTNCISLTSVVIGNGVTSIRDGAFSGCRILTSIEIPDSVTSIGEWVFYGCESLSSVYIKATTPPTLGSSVFNRNASNRKIYVPRASLNAYKTANGWSEYADAIESYDF